MARSMRFIVVMFALWALPTEASRGEIFQDVRYVVDGNSVAPFGYENGDSVLVDNRDPEVGDMIAFGCTHRSCDGKYIKRLTARKDDCYWVEGRRDIWLGSDGREKYSVDSTSTFGWLCGTDIAIIGVVGKI